MLRILTMLKHCGLLSCWFEVAPYYVRKQRVQGFESGVDDRLAAKFVSDYCCVFDQIIPMGMVAVVVGVHQGLHRQMGHATDVIQISFSASFGEAGVD